jgi:hypothetical protein
VRTIEDYLAEKNLEKEEIIADRSKKTSKLKGDKLAEWE